MRYLWVKNGQPFAILVFESPEAKEILINLDRYGNRFDFTGALAVKLHKKYPSQFPPLEDEFGNRHPFWSGGVITIIPLCFMTFWAYRVNTI